MKVAVVGHDKTLPQAGKGIEIDSFDFVVKMNNCGWQWPEDYGSRYDYGIATNSSLLLDGNKMPMIEMWVFNKRGDFDALCEYNDVTKYLSRYIEDGLYRFAGRKFKKGMSRGCAGIIATMSILRPRVIKVFGMHQVMTGTYQKERHPSEYKKVLSLNAEQQNPAPEAWHQWNAENKTVLWAAEEMQCELIY